MFFVVWRYPRASQWHACDPVHRSREEAEKYIARVCWPDDAAAKEYEVVEARAFTAKGADTPAAICGESVLCGAEEARRKVARNALANHITLRE